MPDLRSRLAAFLPRSIWDLLESGADSARREGCVLFADVSGFTPLTESLARIGKEGAEELTRILNDFFGPMIRIIHEEGGDVLRFGGDAMTLFFPGRGWHALDAAVRLQQVASGFHEFETRGGAFSLSIKIGMSHGEVLLGIVGSESLGWDYFAAGPALDLSAEAEHHASKGQIVLCPRCVRNLPPGAAVVRGLEGGFGLLEEALFDGDSGPLETHPQVSPIPPPEAALTAFLPPFIRQKASLRESLGVSEHRKTVVLFIAFEGLDFGTDPEVCSKTRTLFEIVSRATRKYGGWVNKLDMGDKGTKALALFGTPLAIERAEEMGCRAALEILGSDALRAICQGVRAGLTSAPLFAAYIGSDERREFTVMGDGINLAARLMMKAEPWEVMASRDIRERAGAALGFRALEPISVKGKAEPVPIFVPLREQKGEAEERGGRFVGREAILGQLTENLASPREPVVFAISGEAGAGKSALLREVRRHMALLGMRHVATSLSPFSASLPLVAWKDVLLWCLGVAIDESADALAEALRASMPDEDPRYLSLLHPLLGFEAPDSAHLKGLEAKDRKDLIQAMIVRAVLRQASAEPFGIFLDHLEYADGASLDVLKALLAEMGPFPLKLYLAHRPQAPAEVTEALSGLPSVRLEPFGEAEVRQYLGEVWGIPTPSPALVAFLERKTHGNPRFIEEVLEALKSQGILAPGPSGALAADDDLLAGTSFPETLEGLLLARVDALPEPDRHLLKCASVMGPSFFIDQLASVLSLGAEESFARVRSLGSARLLRRDEDDHRIVSFADTLLRDALYESLSFSFRRALHLQVAELMVKAGGEAGSSAAIAGHFEQGGNLVEACGWYHRASQEALARYDNLSAYRCLERFVLLEEQTTPDPAGNPEFLRGLADLAKAALDLGRLTEARIFSETLLEKAPAGSSEKARALGHLAGISRRQGDLKASLDLYEKGMKQARQARDLKFACTLLQDSGIPLAKAGRTRAALRRFRKAEDLARRGRLHADLVNALMNQALAHYFIGNQMAPAIRALRRAILIAKARKLTPKIAHLASNMGQMYFQRGEYRKALATAEESVQIARQFGYRNIFLNSLSNAALYRAMLGDWVGALERTDEALSSARQHRLPYFIGSNWHTRGIVLLFTGDLEGALDAQNSAIASHLKADCPGEALACLSEILTLSNQLKSPGLARPLLEANLPSLAQELSKETHPWVIGFKAQWAEHRFLIGEFAKEELQIELENLLQQSQKARVPWLLAEVSEVLVRTAMEGPGAKTLPSGFQALIAKILTQPCGLKVGPFALCLARLARQRGDVENLRLASAAILRHRRVISKGLWGIRLHRFRRDEIDAARFRAAREEHRRLALRILYEMANLIRREDIRAALFALPEVVEALRGE